ncbi:hypothetical protein BJ508DRAFT_415655 [Ascobolus immersus RN42]|uniref:Uncharacterized protein n=1 Tax=Ascobolus immersus RN42 TaxID=1160509 RepID=A0A3N4I309_ASCIM|nr:hypothetical protein BJ508DRAFT_415655 [Ascobolus immersus RN42]
MSKEGKLFKPNVDQYFRSDSQLQSRCGDRRAGGVGYEKSRVVYGRFKNQFGFNCDDYLRR